MLDSIFNTLSQLLNPVIANFVGWLQGFWETIQASHYAAWQIILDISLVSIFFYGVLKWIHGTRAIRIITGMIVLGVVLMFSRILELNATLKLLDSFLAMMIVAIPVVFQQELRRGLEKLGNNRFFGQVATGGFTEVNHMVRAVEILAGKKQGALIVIQQNTPLVEYIETGVTLNADISRDLILNIFSNRVPLHDGAIIVNENKILAAGCVLPISDRKMDSRLGTRHRSAIGLSEVTDATIIVVSEERGTIAIASDGKLKVQITTEELEKVLRQLYSGEGKKRKK